MQARSSEQWVSFKSVEVLDGSKTHGVIVDQRVVAGIGNIYKSEGLFLAGIHPRRPARSVRIAQLQTMFKELVALMQAGRQHFGAIVTVPDNVRTEQGVRNWVYRRRGRPCLKCGTAIEMERQGALKRMVFYCPSCQKAGLKRA